MPDQLNIILCLCDQLRAFEVGCYGNAVIRTPNMDRLAAEGVRFETAVTSYPICMAARSALLSGQYNRRATGGVSNINFKRHDGGFAMPQYPDPGRPHLKDPTLPELLRGAGYHTAAIGKWHIHSWPHDIGFDHYVIPRVSHCHTGQSFTEDGGIEFVPPGYSVDYEAERVERFLQTKKGGADPFFLYYNISPPHCPLADAPERYRTMYRPEEIPLRPNVDLTKPIDNQDHWFKVYRWDFRYYDHHVPAAENLPPGYALRHLIAEYYGLTTWVDDTLGRMLAALEANGLDENTIVVFASDHGDNLGSHGLVQKGSFNEESIRIPLIIRGGAGIPAGRVNRDTIASLIDLAPTLLSRAGIASPSHFHGQDLSPFLDGSSGAPAESRAFIETPRGAAVRTPRSLCSLGYDESKRHLLPGARQFFDLENDPYQLRNLADSDGQSQCQAELEAVLLEWDRRTPWMS